MAFGGVPAGNMKANEEEKVMGNTKTMGFLWWACAIEATIGMKMEAVATLLLNSGGEGMEIF